MEALQEHPPPDWTGASRQLKVSLRGLRRRVSRMIETDQLFLFPSLDFTRSPGSIAFVGLLLAPGADEPAIRARVLERFPDMIEVEKMFPFTDFLAPKLRASVGGTYPFMMATPSTAAFDALHRELVRLPGVADASVSYPVRNFVVPRLFESAVANKLRGRRPTSRMAEPRSGRSR